MARYLNRQTSGVIRAGSCPGGVGQQFRVQCWDHTWGVWTCYATFRDRAEAEQCARRLSDSGQMTRLIEYSRCATAA